MFKIIIDENIAYAKEAFSQFGEVRLLSGRQITNNELKNTDILIVRSVTKVNESLLRNTPVKFVGTTTIGTDHIDLNYLKKNKIAFADAKGCNAYSVAEYVIASLLFLAVKYDFNLRNKTIGIIGVGNIGSKVASFANAFGMSVLLNDPPLRRLGNEREFVSLEKVLESDIISIHVPLNKEGIDKTYHLLDEKNLSKIKNESILINTARGEVVNNLSLLNLLSKKNITTILDVWENEPKINIELLEKVALGTPHIAGYSREGKINGTVMIYNALCDYLGAKILFQPKEKIIDNNKLELKNTSSLEQDFNNLIAKIYDVKKDSELLKKIFSLPETERELYFNNLRKNYSVRREFNNYFIKINKEDIIRKKILEQLRFKVID